ncbi:hypothetical protein CPB83DRAFT_908550 [Crepidotus variabilis]|uniref:Uncharacterized protein n=1 Tax=Crepidotus variabilis TaxID=179855 RepID=A0A9P6EBY9_9AGAR|nr:hypothetical protein CPB83DRAFT_908550 [Crepidotus variabilis]
MSKPTLVQSILNRPSQSYASPGTQPSKKEYHSTRQEMYKIAAQSNPQSQTTSRSASPAMVPPAPTAAVNKPKVATPRSTTPSSATTQRSKAARRPSRAPSYDDGDNSTTGESDLEVYFTPNTSPRASMASSSTITFPSKRRPNRRSLHSSNASDSAPRSPSGSSFQIVPSTRTPSASSTAATETTERSTNSNLTNRAAYTLSTGSSLSSNSLDAHSVFSDLSGGSEAQFGSTDGSTLLTSPYQSELDIARKGLQHWTPGRAATTTTEMTTTTTIVPVSAYMHAAKGGTAQAAGFGTGANMKNIPPGQQRSAGDEWAKDVKWLVPNSITSTSKAPTDVRSNASAAVNGRQSATTSQARPLSKPVAQMNGVPAPRAFNAFAPLPSSAAKSTPAAVAAPSKAHSKQSSGSSSSTVPPPTRKPVPNANLPATSPTAAKSTANGHAKPPQQNPPTPIASRSQPPTSSSSRGSTTTSSHPPPPASSSRNMQQPSSSRPSGSIASSRPTPANGSSGSRSTSPSSSTSQLSSTSSQSPSTTSSSSNTHNQGHRRNHSTTKVHPSIMMNMSALMEEDEEGPFTPRMERGILELDLASDSEYASGKPKLRHTKERGRDRVQQRSSQDGDAQATMRRRRSRSLDSMSASGSGTVSARSESPTSHSQSTGTASTAGQTATTHRTPQTLSSEVQALTLSSGALPSKGTQGYSSLVLPRAPAPLSYTTSSSTQGRSNGLFSLNLNLTKLSLGSDGKIDLTRSGIAQTTMASVEVVRGLSGANGGILGGGGGNGTGGGSGLSRSGSKVKSMFGAIRKNSTGSRAVPSGSGSSSPSRGPRRAEGVSVDGTPLGFTSYRSPPNHVPSRSVLVQVWAVAVDGVDGRLVGMRFGAGQGPAVGELAREESGTSTPTGDSHVNGAVNGHSQAEDTDTGYDTETTLKKKKNIFAAIGRSLSFSKKKNGGAGSGGSSNGSAQSQSKHKQRSASIQLSGPIPLQPHSSHHSQTSNGSAHHSSQGPPKRNPSISLKRNNTTTSYTSQTSTSTNATTTNLTPGRSRSTRRKTPKPHTPVVGFIPGRSFVGRVLECGWDVRDEVIRKGEWVVGLVDVRKSGALTEFIVVDRHRVHRVPHPRQGVSATDPDAPSIPIWVSSSKPKNPHHHAQQQQQYQNRHHTQYQEDQQEDPETLRTLTLEELALLPLCGLPAYRAVRTFQYAFSSPASGLISPRDTADYDQALNQAHRSDRRPRALVLRGHDGAGAMAVQMLVKRGWRVSVHVPFSCVPANASQALADTFMHNVEDRAREWGADEVIFDDAEEGGVGEEDFVYGGGDGDDGRSAAVRVIETLREEGDVFDAVLDTVGGKEVREAGERLLRSSGNGPASPTTSTPGGAKSRRDGIGQFTTLVGDVPERAIPSAGDHFKANLRSLRLGLNDSTNGYAAPLSPTNYDDNGPPSANLDPKGSSSQGKVGYAWVSVAHDVEWEGEDVGDTLGAVLRMAMDDGIKPLVEDAAGGILGKPRVIPFESTPHVFVENGPLVDGGTVVVKIAA